MRDGRLVVGLVALHVLVAAPGAALLHALGLLDAARPRHLAAAAGPAFLAGLAVAGLPLVLLLVLGVPVTGASSLAVVAAVTGLLVAAGRRRRPRETTARGPVPAPELWLERGLLLAVAAFLALGALAFTHLTTSWDDANIWSLKGLGLFHHGALVPELFRAPELSFVHLDYPVLQPLLEASFFRAIGGVDLRLWHLELWVVLAAALWTLAWLLVPLGRRRPWLLVLGVLAASPVVVADVALGDADVTMAGLLACGVLALGRWLDGGDRALGLLGALFLGAAANVKNEGLAFATAVVVAAVVVVLAGRLRARRRDVTLVAAVVAACVLPWRLWVAGNPAATNQTRAPWALDPDVLVDRLGLLGRGLERVALDLAATDTWGLLTPAFVVVAAVALATGPRRPLASFYLLAWLLAALSVVYTYWVTDIADLDGFEQRSGPRIVLGVAFLAAAGLAHLLAVALPPAVSDGEVGGERPDHRLQP